MDTYHLFGRHIRALRKARNLTQEALAERCGISYRYISDIERGLKNPTLSTFEKIAKGLEVSLSELLAIPGQEKGKRDGIISLLSETSPDMQDKILKAIKSLL